VAGGREVPDRRTDEQTLKPGASVARVALAHGVNANQVFSWCRQYRQGLLSQRNTELVKLLPVHVSEARRRAKRIDRIAGKSPQP
jgi:transposase